MKTRWIYVDWKPLMGFALTVVLVVGGAMAWSQGKAAPHSLFRADMKRELTQEQRQKLDFDLANEATMREHNSYRFDAPNAFEERARWFEETAQWYPIADLMQQMIDFRKSAMRHNEAAFNQLVELGHSGDVGAACIAFMFYRHHKKDVTQNWKYSFESVAAEALRHKDSGHPVCAGMEGYLYLYGDLGYPKDEQRARRGITQSAVTGFYGAQNYMAVEHLLGTQRSNPKDVALYLCWKKVAYAQSPLFSFPVACEAYSQGQALNEKNERVVVLPGARGIVRQWCDPGRTVTAQTCADLEQQTETSGD